MDTLSRHGGGAGALEGKAVASSTYEEERPPPQEIATP
jgi:hypothetical protein